MKNKNKNKNKGFTIVELVIVIAVVAVLAAVLIPTFSAIIKKANISADTQAVRNMNIILAAESADSPAPADAAAVKKHLRDNGITDLTPQTKFYTFFWVEDDNVIILADEGNRPVSPEEYLEREFNFLTWHALDKAEDQTLPIPTLPETSEGEELPPPQTFTVSVTQSGSSVIIPFDYIDRQATEGKEFKVNILLPDEFQGSPIRYAIQKVTAIMHDGEDEYKIELISEKAKQGLSKPFEPGEDAYLEIPCVTGNIEINIDIVEYCHVTLTGPSDHIPHSAILVRKGGNGSIQLSSLIESGRVILSAKAYRNGEFLGELYDEKYGMIRIGKKLTTDDFEIEVELAPIDQTSEPTPDPTE